MSIITYPVHFNDIDLNSISGLTVLKTTPYIPAKRNVEISQIIRTDKGKVTGAFYNERVILVRVMISRANRGLLETSLDSLMALVQDIEGELVLNQSNSRRKYYCTLSDTVVRNDGGSYLEIDLYFECSNRFGYDINPTLLLAISGYTSMTRSDGLSFGGSAPWQTPVITIGYTAISGGTTKTVTIGNSQTGQQVAITRTWAANETLVIDTFNKTVKVNGVEVDYTGAIPEWEKGSGFWYYADNFTTSRTFSGSITHVRRYV